VKGIYLENAFVAVIVNYVALKRVGKVHLIQLRAMTALGGHLSLFTGGALARGKGGSERQIL